MTDLHARILAQIEKKEGLARAANPGPWFFNGYSGIFSGPMVQGHDAWLDPILDQGHNLERYTFCEVCGNWRGEPRPGYAGQGCKYFSELYDREPLIANVPAHHGDTAIRKRIADAEFIEDNNPEIVLRSLAEDRDILQRHPPDFDGNVDAECVTCAELCPCEDIRSLARRHGVEIEESN